MRPSVTSAPDGEAAAELLPQLLDPAVLAEGAGAVHQHRDAVRPSRSARRTPRAPWSRPRTGRAGTGRARAARARRSRRDRRRAAAAADGPRRARAGGERLGGAGELGLRVAGAAARDPRELVAGLGRAELAPPASARRCGAFGARPTRARRGLGDRAADLAQRRPRARRRRGAGSSFLRRNFGTDSRRRCGSDCVRRCSSTCACDRRRVAAALVRFAAARPTSASADRRAASRAAGAPPPRGSRFGPAPAPARGSRRGRRRAVAARRAAAFGPPPDRLGRARAASRLGAPSRPRRARLGAPSAARRRRGRTTAPAALRRARRLAASPARRVVRRHCGTCAGAVACARRAWARRSDGAGLRSFTVDSLPWGDVQRTRRRPPQWAGVFVLAKKPGDDLLSQEDYLQVPSARAVLTAVFGMGTGVSPPPWSPGSNVSSRSNPENSIASTNV